MWSDSMALEGWGLYSEELMAEAAPNHKYGFYSPGEYLYELQGQLLRAVRIRVDVGIHTGRMTFDQAIDYYALSMSAMFLMFGAMFGAFSTIRENREQTMNRMLSSPTPRWEIVAGKMLSVFLLGMAQFVVLYLFTRFVFGVEWGRSIPATLAVAAGEMLAVTGLATLIASMARTERAAGGIGPLVVQIQALIGGAFFTISALPEWVQPIRYLSVVGWAMEGWTTVQVRGGGLADVAGPVAALVAISAALFGIGVWRTEARR